MSERECTLVDRMNGAAGEIANHPTYPREQKDRLDVCDMLARGAKRIEELERMIREKEFFEASWMAQRVEMQRELDELRSSKSQLINPNLNS